MISGGDNRYDDGDSYINENVPLLRSDSVLSSSPGGGGSTQDVYLSCLSSQARRCGAALMRQETLTYMLVAICGMETRLGVTAIAVEK